MHIFNSSLLFAKEISLYIFVTKAKIRVRV